MSARQHRVLIVDDDPAIHEDFRGILTTTSAEASLGENDDLEQALFGSEGGRAPGPCYELDTAHQEQEALACVERAHVTGRPYALAFVDVRTPPGWDGIETIARLWAVDPNLQVVICTADPDYSWDQMVARLGCTDRLLVLKKPFDAIEVRQIAVALTRKWTRARQVEKQIAELEQTAPLVTSAPDMR